MSISAAHNRNRANNILWGRRCQSEILLTASLIFTNDMESPTGLTALADIPVLRLNDLTRRLPWPLIRVRGNCLS